MTEPAIEPRPAPTVESELTPEDVAARLEKLPFATLRAVLAESERLARNTWQEKPDGFENIHGGKIRVYESSRTHKFKLEVVNQESFANIMGYVISLQGKEYESAADAKTAVREILDSLAARIIQ